jgi:hypothetical protein
MSPVGDGGNGLKVRLGHRVGQQDSPSIPISVYAAHVVTLLPLMAR